MNWNKISNKLFSFFMEHKNKIDIGMRVLNLSQYIYKKQHIDAVKTGIELINNIGGEYYYAEDFLNAHNGWHRLFSVNEAHIVDLIDLTKYPCRTFKLKGNSVVSMYLLPNKMEIAAREGSMYWDNGKKVIYYNTHFTKKQQIIDCLAQELFNTLNSQCMVLQDNNMDKQKPVISLVPYVLNTMPSKLSGQLETYLKKSRELNIPRSVMLYSSPGTGKSIVAATALTSLNLKTLKIDNFNKVSTDFIQMLVKIFNIEAILIDDLDHMNINDNSMILDFLEKVRRDVKIIIATVNSTKAFHHALLRPGRFDKIIYVSAMDEEVVKKVLGADLIQYFDRVKDWPIAFVNELALSSRIETTVSLNEIIDHLQKRVGKNNSEDTIDLNKTEEKEDAKKDKKTKKSKKD